MTDSTKNNNDNKSLFLYTALIFLVAIVLIIIAFFGQSNVKRSQPDIKENEVETMQPQSGITERASVLSEENRILLEENNEIKNQLKLQTEEINRLNLEGQNLNKYKKANDILMSANGYLSAGNTEMALEMLNQTDETSLTEDQKILYNSIKKNLE